MTITLIDKSGDLYLKNINSNNVANFNYGIFFQSFYKQESNPLNQKKLSYKEQFLIFENYLKEKDKNSLNDLFLNTINDLSKLKIKDLNYEFLLFLFIEIFKQYQINQGDLINKTIKKYFEDLNLIILENESDTINELESEIKPHLGINSKDLEVLSDKDTYKIRNFLVSITGNKEEININIDIFLCFYYIYFKPQLFSSFVDIKKDKFKEIKSHLIANKKLFNDFNSNVLNFDVMDETENLEQIEELIINFVPNTVEFFKMFSNDKFYSKLVNLSQIEGKMIFIKKICKPKKADNIDELVDYFGQVINLFLKERNMPIYMGKEFYIEYCKLFLNDDLEKIEKIHLMLMNYNKHVQEKSRIKIDKEIDQYYHDTGMYLINNKKLINNEEIEFLKNDPYFQDKENYFPIDLMAEGIIFEEKYTKFINQFFNNHLDDFDLKQFFGHSYYDFMQKIFDKFKKPKDMVLIKNWEIINDIDIEVIENFIYALKRVWLGDPENHMWGLEKLIANAFGIASLKINNFLNILNDFEKKIVSNLLMPIYSELLYRNSQGKFDLSPNLKSRIITYIHYNSDKTAISVWYLLNTYEDDEQKNEYLENNLKAEYAVRAECFINYPSIIDDKITLFTNLYNSLYFKNNENLTNSDYYKESINSKDNIYYLKYLDAMKMYKKITKFMTLFLFFIPGPYSEESNSTVDLILISFSEKCGELKEFYDSLNIIYNYWNKFYKNEKRNEQNTLKDLISNYETSSLKECENLKKKMNPIYSTFQRQKKEKN